ncbi:hypothetical protein Taro_025306 [Colocasia esculenta]|uniref:Uncharacterized protein n=1 Tax=Colocasia esculenta TaxID=4460 RepID=A0A843V8K2_COLES|nr:hypothetical protein [Colocasia esculenta]
MGSRSIQLEIARILGSTVMAVTRAQAEASNLIEGTHADFWGFVGRQIGPKAPTGSLSVNVTGLGIAF